jgi:GT2 family glycosyltransferase
MAHQNSNIQPAVDVVIPVYGERSEALSATLSACSEQTYSIRRIIVVDDGSPQPVSKPHWEHASVPLSVLRLPENLGISGARNAGIAQSTVPLIACINTEVLPDPDWLASCSDYLLARPSAGACYTRLVSATPQRLLTRWRMRFLETKFGEVSGPSEFAPGHAVLFRREALEAVGGYDVHYRLHHEDSDICQRMWKAGWETHYVAQSRCVSIQRDTLRQLAAKELRESYWYSPAESSLLRLYLHLSKWTAIRASRNLVTGRIYFLPVDVAIWATALWTATARTLRLAR